MIAIEPVAHVRNARAEIEDDGWGAIMSRIELVPALPEEALEGLEAFSHAEILFHFDRVDSARVEAGARHPRHQSAWPKVGIFAQRCKNRPNRLGSTIVKIAGREGRALIVEGLDAIDGTPVVDIKPVMRAFLPREPVTEPAWATALMARYWDASSG